VAHWIRTESVDAVQVGPPFVATFTGFSLTDFRGTFAAIPDVVLFVDAPAAATPNSLGA